jgi:hypothetical protein
VLSFFLRKTVISFKNIVKKQLMQNNKLSGQMRDILRPCITVVEILSIRGEVTIVRKIALTSENVSFSHKQGVSLP